MNGTRTLESKKGQAKDSLFYFIIICSYVVTGENKQTFIGNNNMNIYASDCVLSFHKTITYFMIPMTFMT